MTILTPASQSAARIASKTNLMLDKLLWIVVAVSFMWMMVSPYIWSSPLVVPLFVLTLPFTVIHALRCYDICAAVFFMVSIYLISNVYENLSVITGFPFGHYHYTGYG
jgi:uncharacterized membrane protein